ncbi:MopE-related protein [candidate division KSB1 bacterium]
MKQKNTSKLAIFLLVAVLVCGTASAQGVQYTYKASSDLFLVCFGIPLSGNIGNVCYTTGYPDQEIPEHTGGVGANIISGTALGCVAWLSLYSNFYDWTGCELTYVYDDGGANWDTFSPSDKNTINDFEGYCCEGHTSDQTITETGADFSMVFDSYTSNIYDLDDAYMGMFEITGCIEGTSAEGRCVPFCVDNDGDGWNSMNPDLPYDPNIFANKCFPIDCNDWNGDAHDGIPGTPEICNGYDEDCDGKIDEGCDSDWDGYIDPDMECTAGAKCAANDGNPYYSTCQGCAVRDCYDMPNTVYDRSDLIYPGAPEICDGRDNDCSDPYHYDGVEPADIDEGCDEDAAAVFVTFSGYSGDLGGMEGADQICMQEASGNTFLAGKVFKAWLSDNTIDARDRLFHYDKPYKTLDGTLIAEDWNDLVTLDDGTNYLKNPINVDASGRTPQVPELVWSSTYPDGTWTGSGHCGGWADHTLKGQVGMRSRTDDGWSVWGLGDCNSPPQPHLYCFEQPTNLICYVKDGSCSASEVSLFSMFDNVNSHVGLPDTYTKNLCCYVPGVPLQTTCVDENSFVLSKFQDDDSHVSVSRDIPHYYTNDVCLSVAGEGSIMCYLDEDPSNGRCEAGGDCVITAYKKDDSHVADCESTNAYDNSVCCGFTPVTRVCGNGIVEGTEECDDGNQISGDGCSATCLIDCSDLDGDGYGTGNLIRCAHPEPDCDDTRPEVHPGAEEICGNLIDEDCDMADLPCCSLTSAEWVTPDLATYFGAYIVSANTPVDVIVRGEYCEGLDATIKMYEDDTPSAIDWIGDFMDEEVYEGWGTQVTFSCDVNNQNCVASIIGMPALYKTHILTNFAAPTEIGKPEYYFIAELDDQEARSGLLVVSGNEPPTAPDNFLIEPNGGEHYNKSANVSWSPASDPDDDALVYGIEYSTDAGQTWNPLVNDYGYNHTGEYKGVELESITLDFGEPVCRIGWELCLFSCVDITSDTENCGECNNVCAVGESCMGGVCQFVCGDGTLDTGEECDDGNNLDGDGCSAVCVEEVCGDGTCQPFEDCGSCDADCGACPLAIMTCDVKTDCEAGELALLSMYDNSNSHVGSLGYYTNHLCCKVEGLTLETASCTADNFVLSKYQPDDSHVSRTQGTGEDICLSVAEGGAVTCTFDTNPGDGLCNAGGTCVATMFQTDNSHLADCNPVNAYDNAICCEYNEGVDPGSCLAVSGNLCQAEWELQEVDSGGQFNSIAIDSNDYPHISYTSFSNNLKYAKWTGAGWDIPSLPSVVADGMYTSITLPGGNPHIAYADIGNNMRELFWTGAVWIDDIIKGDADWTSSQVAADSNSVLHMSYGDVTGLNYMADSGGAGVQWTEQIIDTSSGSFHKSSLAFDSDDNPHISYYEGINVNLKYATYVGVGGTFGGNSANCGPSNDWYCDIVDGVDDVGRLNSIAIDSNNYPHISYYDDTNGDLKYAKYTGTGWDIQPVDLGITLQPNPLSSFSIEIDSDDNPHMIYAGIGGLKYARWTGTGWDIQPVDDLDSSDGSLKLDSNDNPHISYHTSDLKYAYLPSCTPDPSCGCPAGETDCSGTCVDTDLDDNNCGACGTVCAGGESCVAGVCVIP